MKAAAIVLGILTIGCGGIVTLPAPDASIIYVDVAVPDAAALKPQAPIGSKVIMVNRYGEVISKCCDVIKHRSDAMLLCGSWYVNDGSMFPIWCSD